MSAEYQEFVAVLGALARLVVLSIVLERLLAFVFEHDWFTRLTSVTAADPGDVSKQIRVQRIPGLKGFIALAVAVGLCFAYQFDILGKLFAQPTRDLGIVITGIVAAGGSAGAIAIFQGFLNMNKEARDAMIAARKANAEAARQQAEATVERAQAATAGARAEKLEAQARVQAAVAHLQRF